MGRYCTDLFTSPFCNHRDGTGCLVGHVCALVDLGGCKVHACVDQADASVVQPVGETNPALHRFANGGGPTPSAGQGGGGVKCPPKKSCVCIGGFSCRMDEGDETRCWHAVCSPPSSVQL
ncbi:hypothetical protein HDU98_001776 [Podochytrium sp. JEL0797]|nr:hypothetical protein HDU98_001776 [Podochytrium sp. JEL0797]